MNKFQKVGAAVGTMLASGAAMAQTTTLSSGFTTEVAAQKPELLIIAGIVLSICAIVLVGRKAQRTSGG